jgi:hypothetical protein
MTPARWHQDPADELGGPLSLDERAIADRIRRQSLAPGGIPRTASDSVDVTASGSARGNPLAPRAAAASASESSIEHSLAKWARAPGLDRRIRRGDDFAGDAWRNAQTGELRYVAVGHRPEEGAHG